MHIIEYIYISLFIRILNTFILFGLSIDTNLCIGDIINKVTKSLEDDNNICFDYDETDYKWMILYTCNSISSKFEISIFFESDIYDDIYVINLLNLYGNYSPFYDYYVKLKYIFDINNNQSFLIKIHNIEEFKKDTEEYYVTILHNMIMDETEKSSYITLQTMCNIPLWKVDKNSILLRPDILQFIMKLHRPKR